MHGLLLRCVLSTPGTNARKTPQPLRLIGEIQAWPIRWFSVGRFNSVCQCGNRLRDGQTAVTEFSPVFSSIKTESDCSTALIIEQARHR